MYRLDLDLFSHLGAGIAQSVVCWAPCPGVNMGSDLIP